MTIGKLTSLVVTGPQSLELEWDDGFIGQVDLSEILALHPALKPIRVAKNFAKAELSDDGWSVEWPEGIDFGAPQLRRWMDEQSGEVMPASDFRDWMGKYNLTLDSAASALGLSRRMIAYYVSGEKAIPKTVLLATRGWRAQRDRRSKTAVEDTEINTDFLIRGMEKKIVGAAGGRSSKERAVFGRDAASGQFVTVAKARSRDRTTIVERIPKSGRSSPIKKK